MKPCLICCDLCCSLVPGKRLAVARNSAKENFSYPAHPSGNRQIYKTLWFFLYTARMMGKVQTTLYVEPCVCFPKENQA
jgi:hypothetical protein